MISAVLPGPSCTEPVERISVTPEGAEKEMLMFRIAERALLFFKVKVTGKLAVPGAWLTVAWLGFQVNIA